MTDFDRREKCHFLIVTFLSKFTKFIKFYKLLKFIELILNQNEIPKIRNGNVFGNRQPIQTINRKA